MFWWYLRSPIDDSSYKHLKWFPGCWCFGFTDFLFDDLYVRLAQRSRVLLEFPLMYLKKITKIVHLINSVSWKLLASLVWDKNSASSNFCLQIHLFLRKWLLSLHQLREGGSRSKSWWKSCSVSEELQFKRKSFTWTRRAFDAIWVVDPLWALNKCNSVLL